MALPIFQRTVVDDAGNVLAGATVTITNEATGTAATIYSDRNGSVPLTNPFTTGSDGLARFYAAAGEYRVQASLGGTAVDWRYQVLTGTAARSDVTTSSTDTTAGRLLKVGDFSLGSPTAPIITAWTSNSGVYYISDITAAGFSGRPSGAAGPWVLVVERGNNYTLYKMDTAANRKIYHQVSSSYGVPLESGWQEILHTGNTKGLAGYGDTATDFNTQTINGFYKGSGISAGVPYAGNWEMIQNQFDANSGFQIMADAGAATVEMYARVKSAGNWQSHVEILHTGNMVGTVNSSKTGAIIERGSNANGEYVKFADGTLICSRSVSHDFSSAGVTSYTYPASFTNLSSVVSSVSFSGTSSGARLSAYQSTVLMNDGVVQVWTFYHSVTVAETLSVRLFAYGRWY